VHYGSAQGSFAYGVWSEERCRLSELAGLRIRHTIGLKFDFGV